MLCIVDRISAQFVEISQIAPVTVNRALSGNAFLTGGSTMAKESEGFNQAPWISGLAGADHTPQSYSTCHSISSPDCHALLILMCGGDLACAAGRLFTNVLHHRDKLSVRVGLTSAGNRQVLRQSKSATLHKAYRLQRIKEIDGLRAIAILGVFSCHFARQYHGLYLLKLGWAGVDLFFGISGFLITSILIGLRQDHAPYRTFYPQAPELRCAGFRGGSYSS